MVYNGVVLVQSYTSIALLDKVYKVCKYIFDAHLGTCNQVQGPVTHIQFIYYKTVLYIYSRSLRACAVDTAGDVDLLVQSMLSRLTQVRGIICDQVGHST